MFLYIIKIPLFFTISSPRLNKKKEKHNKSTWFAIQVTVLTRIIQIAPHAFIHLITPAKNTSLRTYCICTSARIPQYILASFFIDSTSPLLLRQSFRVTAHTWQFNHSCWSLKNKNKTKKTYASIYIFKPNLCTCKRFCL